MCVFSWLVGVFVVVGGGVAGDAAAVALDLAHAADNWGGGIGGGGGGGDGDGVELDVFDG